MDILRTKIFPFLGLLTLSTFFILPTDMHRIVMYFFLASGLIFILDKRFLSPLWADHKTLLSLFGVFLIYNFISYFWGEGLDGQRVIDAIKIPIFIAGFILCIAYLLLNHKGYSKLIALCFISTAILTILFLVIKDAAQGQFLLSEIGKTYRLQAEGVRIGNSNVLAKFLLVALILVCFETQIFHMFKHQMARRTFTVFIGALLVLGLIFTGGRGAILALLVTIIITAIISKKTKYVLGATGIIILGAVVAAAHVELLEMFLMRADSHRFEMWQLAWDFIKQNPVWGQGAGTETRYEFSGKHSYSTHNVIIGAAVYGGVVGVIVLSILALYAVYAAYGVARQNSYYIPFALLVSGGILFMFTGHTLYLNLNPEWLFCWFPLAYLLAANRAEIKGSMRSD